MSAKIRSLLILGIFVVFGCATRHADRKDASAQMTPVGHAEVEKARVPFLDRAYLPIHGASPSDKIQYLEVSLTGRWSVSDTGDSVVLGKNGSAQVTRGGHTVIGSYYMGAPDLLIVLFPSSIPSEKPQVYELMFRAEDMESRTLRFPTEGRD
jgi:hypothetical protein